MCVRPILLLCILVLDHVNIMTIGAFMTNYFRQQEESENWLLKEKLTRQARRSYTII